MPSIQLQKAYNIIELMVITAIIGLLTTLAIFSYKTYIAKANVANMLEVGVSAIEIVDNYFARNLSVSGLSSLQTLNTANVATVNTYASGNNAYIVITGISGAIVSGQTVAIAYTATPNSSGSALLWSCATNSAGQNYAPSSCQTLCANTATCP